MIEQQTWSSDSRNLRIIEGMIPLTPPPSMLRIVTTFPSDPANITFLVFKILINMEGHNTDKEIPVAYIDKYINK